MSKRTTEGYDAFKNGLQPGINIDIQINMRNTEINRKGMEVISLKGTCLKTKAPDGEVYHYTVPDKKHIDMVDGKVHVYDDEAKSPHVHIVYQLQKTG